MKLNEITLEITQQCPNFCIHCSSLSSLTCQIQLDWDAIKAAIDDAISLGVTIISLSGGEPFLHPDILKIVRYIHSCQAACNIYTGGIYHDGIQYMPLPESMLRALCGQVDKLIYNIEAADEQTYEEIMGVKGGFHHMITSIQRSVRMGLLVESHTVLMKINYQLIPQIFELCEKLKVSKLSFLRLVMQGRALENVSKTYLTDEEITDAKKIIRQCSEDFSGKIRLGMPLCDCLERKNCLAGTVKLNIRYDGNVYPCEAFKNDLPSNLSSNKPENINDKPLRQIYAENDYLKDIRSHLENYVQMNTCETCISQYYMKHKKYILCQ